MRTCLALLLLSGCPDGPKAPIAADAALDLTEPLGAGEVRAGVVTDEGALFGGISAEGQAGDIKIYNDRARFVIQATENSDYYVGYKGSVIDADIVRAAGQPGQDMIDDAGLMVGFGRMFAAETVELIHDGRDGKAAVVRAEGGGGPLHILTGTLENDELIAERDVWIRTDYTLEPDSPLLRMDTTVWWEDRDTPIQLADMAFLAFDVTEAYLDGAGSGGALPDTYGWAGAVGRRNEVALAIMEAEGEFVANSVLQAISDLAPLLLGSTESTILSDGDVLTWARFLGVGPDLATLTDAWLAGRAEPTETVGGIVTSDAGPVPGARVHVLDAEGRPLTMAITDAAGEWSAHVVSGEAQSVLATSRGPGVSFDLPAGAGWYGPYAAPVVKERILSTITDGAEPNLFSPGFGVSEPKEASTSTTLQLTEPGQLEVAVADGGPAVVRIDFAEADPVTTDPALAQSRPSGHAGWLYIRDGEGSMALEPGSYTVVVHRGMRFEPHVETVQISSGASTSVSASLAPGFEVPGFWALDPHSHGAPSGDGSIPMEGRLVVHAAHGIDVHFGTDHDHVADYRVLLAPLGLDKVLGSVVADEVSPSLRGHHNAYPLEVDPDEANGGAVAWYKTWTEWLSTTGLYERIRAMASDGEILIQANHPSASSGLFSNAKYRLADGAIGDPNKWSPDFDAMEVLNDGGYVDSLAYYLDLINRGLRPSPVGVSDSHSHRGGAGQNMTWAPLDLDKIENLDNDHIRAGIGDGHTVVSHGPFIEARIDGAWAPGADVEGPVELEVTVHGPSWMVVDTLTVLTNGVEQQVEEITMGETIVISLAPTSDSVVVLTCEGETDMAPVYPGQRPWAMTAGIFIDADGDGDWTPPLPPLSMD